MNPQQFCQVRGVFERAMQMPAESRNAYIYNACGDDTELLSELELMVEAAGAPDGARGIRRPFR